MILIFALIPTQVPLVIGTIIWFTNGTLFGFNVMNGALIATIIEVPLLIACHKWLDLLCPFNIVVFTDMAIYTSRNFNGLKIAQIWFHRIPYTEIKAYAFEIKGLSSFPAKMAAIIYTSFDIASNSYEIKFTGDVIRKKQIFESFIHAYHPASMQRAKFFEKKGRSDLDYDKIHPISISILREIHAKKKTFKLAAPIVDPVIVLAGTSIILAISATATQNIPVIVETWYFELAFLLIMIAAISSQVNIYKKLSSFHASENSNFNVNGGEVEFQASDTSINLPFRSTSIFVPGHSVKMKRYDFIAASTIENMKKDVKLGPVDDLLEMYYDIMVNYYSWLESKEYFLVPDDIAAINVKGQQEMARIAKKLLLQEEARVPITPIEARTRLKEQLEVMDDFDIKTATFDESKHALKYPIERYLDHVENGEEICFIHHPARSHAQIEELVFTTKGIIVVGSGIFGAPSKIMYDDILSVNLGEVSSNGKNFKRVILNLRPKEIVNQVLLDHAMEGGAHILHDIEKESHVIIGAIPLDSLIFAVLKKIGNVPINF